ncbi:unnamed protein product [Larinioides sclopetarius]|uniref:Uncharacterized protein n=1 Tax=Larinioides sclopetarius TaxID=280406 RepID=A0AAV2B425_9ARAC
MCVCALKLGPLDENPVAGLMLGFMMTTMFLSMWISNTATTAMMVPIVDAVLDELEKEEKKTIKSDGSAISMITIRSNMSTSLWTPEPDKNHYKINMQLSNSSSSGTKKDYRHLRDSLLLSIAYAANCGGTGTAVPGLERADLRFLAHLQRPRHGHLRVSVLDWIAVLLSALLEHQGRDSRGGRLPAALHHPFQALPHRAQPPAPQLAHRTEEDTLGGAAPARERKSHLSVWLSGQLSYLNFLSPAVICIILTFMASILTEVISNMSMATIMLPVVSEMAEAIKVHPFFLMLPVTIGCSFAMILPVGNPSNAIVFDASSMKTFDMMKPGVILKFLCCIVELFMIQTLGVALFDLQTFPDWANKTAVLANTNPSINWTLLTNVSSLANTTLTSLQNG